MDGKNAVENQVMNRQQKKRPAFRSSTDKPILKWFGFLLIITLHWALISPIAGLELDRGGVSVDFKQFHDVDPIDSDVLEQPNLIPNGTFKTDSTWGLGDNGRPEKVEKAAGGWRNDFWYYTTKQPEKSEHVRKLAPLGERELSKQDPLVGNFCFKLSMADEHKEKNSYGASFSNNLSLNVINPHSKESTNYILSFAYKAQFSPLGGKLNVYIPFRPGNLRRHIFEEMPGETLQWKRDHISFAAPKGTESFTVQFRFTGYGTVFIDDVRLVKDDKPRTVTMAMLPFSFIDETYYLPSGQPGILQLTARNAAAIALNKPQIVLTLPENIRILGLRNGSKALHNKTSIEEDGRKSIEYRISYSIPSQIQNDRYNQSYGEFILLETDLPAGEILYPAACYFSDGDFEGKVRNFQIKIMEPVNGKQPSLFKTGGHVWHEFTYSEEEALRKLAEFYAEIGFNVIQLGTASNVKMSTAFKKAGIYRYIQKFLVNGYNLYQNQVGAEMPDQVKYLNKDSEPLGSAICPAEIYKTGEYFAERIVPAFRKTIVENDLAESIMCNWEPFMYRDNGCFCDRCKREFIRYFNLPQEQVEDVWPAKVVAEYDSEWIEFRSWQHAQLVLTLERTLAALGREAGKDSHFIPEVSNGFKRSEWRKSHFDPRDYMRELPVIQAWGPYIYHRFTRPYVYRLGEHLSLYRRAVEPIAFLESAIEIPEARPELIAFPQGIQAGDWIQEPEALAFQTLAFFISGWHGSIAYFFPGGFDGRYYRAMAEANTLIADHEQIVFKGKRRNRKKRFELQILSPMPRLIGPAKDDIEQKLVQAQEYVYKDKHLFVVGNFWQKGDVWLKIIPSVIPSDGHYVLRETSRNRFFSNAGGSCMLTPHDLHQGITVHVGALRWAFLTLEPWRENMDYGEKVEENTLKELLDKYRDELARSAEIEDNDV